MAGMLRTSAQRTGLARGLDALTHTTASSLQQQQQSGQPHLNPPQTQHARSDIVAPSRQDGHRGIPKQPFSLPAALSSLLSDVSPSQSQRVAAEVIPGPTSDPDAQLLRAISGHPTLSAPVSIPLAAGGARSSPEQQRRSTAAALERYERYERAAALGHGWAQMNLAVLLARGEEVAGIGADPTRAVALLQQAVGNGVLEAMVYLGMQHCHGSGLPLRQDKPLGAGLLRLAADQGDPHAQLQLGICYLRGLGVPSSPIVAKRWFERAADQGNADAQYNLAVLLAHDPPEVQQRDAAASEEAAGQPSPTSFGTDDVGKRRPAARLRTHESRAVRWYKAAAAQGHMEAQFNLGCALHRHDPEAASAAYKDAAAQGHLGAAFNRQLLRDSTM